MKVTCQHTGIEFEAKSKRSKNHPRVSALLNEAQRFGQAGAYQLAKDLLGECRDAEITDIDQVIEMVEAGLADYNASKMVEVTKFRRELKAMREENARWRREHAHDWVHPDNVENDVIEATRATRPGSDAEKDARFAEESGLL